MNLINLIRVISILILCVRCNIKYDEDVEGNTYKEYYKSGVLKAQYDSINQHQSVLMMFDTLGRLESKALIVDGKLNGPLKRYDVNTGRVVSLEGWKEDVPHGFSVEFSSGINDYQGWNYPLGTRFNKFYYFIRGKKFLELDFDEDGDLIFHQGYFFPDLQEGFSSENKLNSEIIIYIPFIGIPGKYLTVDGTLVRDGIDTIYVQKPLDLFSKKSWQESYPDPFIGIMTTYYGNVVGNYSLLLSAEIREENSEGKLIVNPKKQIEFSIIE